MKLLNVDTIEQAREKIISYIKQWQIKTERLPLLETLDRILAQDIYSPCDIPSFRRSTVDGYAVIANDTSGAGESIPVLLKQISSVSMGKIANFSIKSGECAYVPTGGMLPEGADAVVMIEYSEKITMKKDRITDCENDIYDIAVYEAVASGTGTVEIGEDFKNGDILLKSGTRIRSQEIGALCAAGITHINVFASLTVSIFSTGDELIPPEKEPVLGEIRDINTNLLKALAEKNGYKVLSAQILADDEGQIETALKKAMALNDIVLISGGSSQGEKDFTAKIIDKLAKPGVFTQGLAVKPGKPTILAWDEKTKTLLAGLPGHPVSAMMIFLLLFGWLMKIINKELEIKDLHITNCVSAKINCNVPGSSGRMLCLPVSLQTPFVKNENDLFFAEPIFGKAGMISTLTLADGYIIIDMNKEGLKKDEIVTVYLF